MNVKLNSQTYKTVTYDMLRLISGLFDESAAPVKLSDGCLVDMFTIAKHHHLTALTALALKRTGIKSEPFEIALAQSQRRMVLMKAEYSRLSQELARERIAHMPLKGIVVSDMYPSFGTREISDIDILIDPDAYEAVFNIMSKNGYDVVHYNKTNHDVYQKPPLFTVEMHRTLFDRDYYKKKQAYFDAQNYQLNKDNPYLMQMTIAQTYIYLVTHMHMHYATTGIGLRSLLDIYLFLKDNKDKLDFEAIQNEMQEIGIANYEIKMRNLAEKFLYPDKLLPEEAEELDYYIFSGMSGKKQQLTENLISEWQAEHPNGTKLGYIRKRFALSDRMIRDDPFYSKHPKLLPLMYVTRPIKAVFTKPKALITEWTILKNHFDH